ncbi:chloroplast ribosomal protein S20 precursor [Klebsormidium nitens]|uniref:Chloroplast ribosomal protein S20 n=1 Tax=Klebsormidium nitens TaxID=105231 RepID=A0A1Y1HVN3_KLENI|nr:chloroplast ribosomal protein S20 precursor [Klebsormidium nitens]|eukprot:GAQ81872.1 chloroplast ribosomal protein S20 precursor [Klebsormidium nitens]
MASSLTAAVQGFERLSLASSSRNGCSISGSQYGSMQGSALSGAPRQLSSASFIAPRLPALARRQVSVQTAPGLQILAKQNALKRTRQNEKRRAYHKARKSEMSTRIKKVLMLTEQLKGKPEDAQENLTLVEKYISEAYKIIDKSAKVGTIHKNRANRRKSRLAFAKKSVEVALGLYTPPPPPEVRAASSKVADEDQADKVTVVSV